ncbi:MAG TPA: MFS transporter, partial [Pyrinomonadaceae bacterium]|nr:MFS transporter [Pyrinomonadaceae bacterium]
IQKPAESSTWKPLANSLFRALWIAAVASNIGTWMHNVGADWLMTALAPSPWMVALMQTAENAPLFMLALPAGALADIVDRRRLLLYTQAWMLVSAVSLAALTFLGLTTPWVLLLLIFSLGLGSALNAPAWQAIIPDLVPRAQLPAAVSLNSVAFNIARAVGPALGGILVAAVGSWAVFLLNSLSFVGVILVLYHWKREPVESVSPTERIVGAMRAGVRYVRHDPNLRAVFVRTGVYVSCASALWAMMPLVARRELGLGAFGYGVLLGGLGAGAILAAFILPALRRRFSINTIVFGGTIIFAAGIAVLATVRNFPLLCLAMIAAGVAWMSLMSSFNVSVQTIVPSWVRARVLAIYMLVFFGGMALGSAVWGVVATHLGISPALLCAAAAMIVGLGAAYFFPLRASGGLDLEPSMHWPDPLFVTEPHPKAGPVLVTVEYQIEPERAADFMTALSEVKRILQRDGALRWGLFADPAQPGHYLETFLVESWAEHMRQHARVTGEDRRAQDRARSFHIGASPPVVTHLIAQDISKPSNGNDRDQPVMMRKAESDLL